MGTSTLIMTFIIAMGIPSAITSLAFWAIKKKLDYREREQDEKDKARRNNEIIVIESVNAAVALSEATARAVQRIPDAKCNGDMHKALDYAEQIKHKHRDFMTEQGINALY